MKIQLFISSLSWIISDNFLTTRCQFLTVAETERAAIRKGKTQILRKDFILIDMDYLLGAHLIIVQTGVNGFPTSQDP